MGPSWCSLAFKVRSLPLPEFRIRVNALLYMCPASKAKLGQIAAHTKPALPFVLLLPAVPEHCLWHLPESR
jgi:hypothetical protein